MHILMTTCGLLLFLLSGCGGGLKTSKNEFLGEIPSIQRYYYDKTEEKDRELKACTDMEKAFKLDKEKQLLKDEWDSKITERMKTNPLTTPLPFEPLKDQSWTITGISVNLVNTMGFECKIAMRILTDIRFEYKDLFLYYKAVDKDGKDIPDTKVRALVRQELGKDLKAGTEMETVGCWTIHGMVNLENFSKVRFITQEEYERR